MDFCCTGSVRLNRYGDFSRVSPLTRKGKVGRITMTIWASVRVCGRWTILEEETWLTERMK